VNHNEEEATEKLAALLGIEPGYYDNWGRRHETPVKTRAAIIRSMGIEDPAAYLRELGLRPWNRFVEPAMVVSVNGQPQAIPVYFPLEEGSERGVTIAWRIEDEAGGGEFREFRGVRPVEESTIDGVRYVKVNLPNETDRELGYYVLKATCATPSGEFSGEMRLIITPDRCFTPEKPAWGISLNLYSLRSRENWGVGDLTDLREVARWTARELGADFIGINPLHAIPNRMPFGVSPYSSTSRLYRNFLYIGMKGVLRETPEGKEMLKDKALRDEIKALRRGSQIDYEKTAALKMRALRAAFSHFRGRDLEKKGEDFKKYVREEGKALLDFATYMALGERLRAGNPGLQGWQDWPAEYHDSGSPAVEEFRKAHGEDILFYQYVQWLLDRQMKGVRKASGDMAIGVYQDLAVGSSKEGSDAWSHPGVFAFGVSAGAPPDAFNLNGQNWGFPPFIPHRLRESGYELFIQTIRKNLDCSGALRIDHALGLFRLFFIPEGMSPVEGTYTRYPSEDMLRIIALESVRNRAVIIAEDLGTIGEEVREALMRFGMLSYRLFYFERDWSNFSFLPPQAYPRLALTAVTTHDLPTLYGYWEGRDIEVKRALGLYPDEESCRRDSEERTRDRQLMLSALADYLPENFPLNAASVPEMSPRLSLAIHRYLARTPCKLVSVCLDDVLEARDQQNMPGTLDTHPNWRQKVRLSTKGISEHPGFKEITAMFREESRAR
jgi:4-alpha-glucanotransferase